MHWISDCYYLVPGRRPQSWKPNAGKQKKIDDALQNNKTKAWVDKLLEKYKNKSRGSGNQGTGQSSSSVIPGASSSNQTSSSTDPTRGRQGSFAGDTTGAFVCSSFSTTTWQLQGSWILDNGSNSHVCNRTMLTRFTKTREAGSTDNLMAGTQVIPIECFGTVTIVINTPVRPKTMTLLNVAYVPDFMTNLVSQTILSSKGLYFDN